MNFEFRDMLSLLNLLLIPGIVFLVKVEHRLTKLETLFEYFKGEK
jgi:hypothetical protein